MYKGKDTLSKLPNSSCLWTMS